MSKSRLESLLQMVKENQKNMFLHFAIAKEYENAQQLDLALEKYRYIFKIDPDYIGNYYHFGKCLELVDQQEKALEIYQKGIEKGKSQGDFHAVSELNNAKMNLELEM